MRRPEPLAPRLPLGPRPLRRAKAARRLLMGALALWLPVVDRRDCVAQELPSAPAGFSWQRLSEMKGAVLLPASWRHKCCQGDMGWLSTETETGVSDPAKFSLHVIRSARARSRQEAEKVASQYLAGLSGSLKALKTWDSTHGPFVGRAGFYAEVQGQASSRRNAFIQVLVSPNTSTLCIVIFDAPSGQWDEKWKLGQVIADTFVLEDEI